jgi:MoxR-like ATPase
MKNSTTQSTTEVETADINVAKTAPKARKPRTKKVEAEIIEEPTIDRMKSFVFMDKAIDLLNIGLKTENNIVLYGPGGHGKSELALEFFYSQGINPFILTMGSGMTVDRLFGGTDIKALDEGKIEYLFDNSMFNHEFVILEEMMDAPDYILEALKDSLSRGEVRNGSQVYPSKIRYIVCNTNKTRDEFSKNDSLKALMERFPLELNVVWDNYTEIAYTTLLENRFGAGRVDPTIPFILQEYVKAGVTISPRIALTCYSVYETCGPDSLLYFADFAKKPEVIREALKKFQANIKFKEAGVEVTEMVKDLEDNTGDTPANRLAFIQTYKKLSLSHNNIKKMVVNDDMAAVHANLIKAIMDAIVKAQVKHDAYVSMIKKAKTTDETPADDFLANLGEVAEDNNERPF